MQKVKLPIFFLNKTTELKEATGIEYDLDENDVRDILFFNIEAISEYSNDDRYSTIYACGTSFVCAWPMNKLEKVLSNEGK